MDSIPDKVVDVNSHSLLYRLTKTQNWRHILKTAGASNVQKLFQLTIHIVQIHIILYSILSMILIQYYSNCEKFMRKITSIIRS